MVFDKRFAVVGNPVDHSLSPVVHASFASQFGINLTYTKLKGDEHDFENQVHSFFAAGGQGLNITLPFKERAFDMADVTSARCSEAGAANTLWMKQGELHADNTDGVGLVRDLTRYRSLKNQSVLVLGAGGAARGIVGLLLAANIKALHLVNRDRYKAQVLQELFEDIYVETFESLDGKGIDIIINATSAGLKDNRLNLPPFLWMNSPFCYDLTYNISEATPFVATALAEHCEACDGLGMLVEQAAESFYIWHGLRPDTEHTLKALRGG